MNRQAMSQGEIGWTDEHGNECTIPQMSDDRLWCVQQLRRKKFVSGNEANGNADARIHPSLNEMLGEMSARGLKESAP